MPTRSKKSESISKDKNKIKKATQVLLKKRRQNYNKEDVEKAKNLVSNGMKIGKAADMFGIPYTTLADRVKGRYKSINLGNLTYLDQDVEILLANAILCLSKWGFGLNFTHMKFIVKDFLFRNGKTNKFKVSKISSVYRNT